MSSFIHEYRVEDLRLALVFEPPSTSKSDILTSKQDPSLASPVLIGSGNSENTQAVGLADGGSGKTVVRKPKTVDPALIHTRVVFKSNRKFGQELCQDRSLPPRQVASDSNLAEWDIDNETDEEEDAEYEYEEGVINQSSGLEQYPNKTRSRNGTLSRSSTLYSEDETIAEAPTPADTEAFEGISTPYATGAGASSAGKGEKHLGSNCDTVSVFPCEDVEKQIQLMQNTSQTKSSQIHVGSSMKTAPEQEWVPNSWCDGDASDFKVRTGPNYAKYKKKTSSDKPLYRTIACDVLRNVYDEQTKIHHIAGRDEIVMPELDGIDMDMLKKSCLPGIIVCNCQIPLKPPKMMGKPEPDPGVSLVFYYQITQETLSQSLDPAAASPAVKQLIRFVKEATFNKDVRRRFKLIGMVMNMAELGLPSFLRGYNGKPAIINKSGQLFFGKTSGPTSYPYMEMDILVHTFAFIAKKGLYSVKDSISKMNIRAGFVIQAEEDDEMPECLFGCTGLFNLNYEDALPINLFPKQWVAH